MTKELQVCILLIKNFQVSEYFMRHCLPSCTVDTSMSNKLKAYCSRKVKSLCLRTISWRHIWGMEQSFSTSALDEGQWSASSSSYFNHKERAPRIQWKEGCAGSKTSMDIVATRTTLAHAGNWIVVIQPAASHFTEQATWKEFPVSNVIKNHHIILHTSHIWIQKICWGICLFHNETQSENKSTAYQPLCIQHVDIHIVYVHINISHLQNSWFLGP